MTDHGVIHHLLVMQILHTYQTGTFFFIKFIIFKLKLND